MEWLVQMPAAIFTSTIAIVFIITIIEVIGIVTGLAGMETDGDAELDTGFIAWLGIGRVPLIIVFIIHLTFFGMIGLGIEAIMHELIGRPLTAWIAVPIALTGSIPSSRWIIAGLARILPGTETSAVSPDGFIGTMAQVVRGTATSGSPAEGKLIDAHGQRHELLIEPDMDRACERNGVLS